MRIVAQRVKDCTVTVNGETEGSILKGLLVYLGVEAGDTASDLDYLVNKVAGLRVFRDSEGKMNLSVKDVSASVLVVSQFTICADTRKGFRPSYNNAAAPEIAREFYNSFILRLSERGINVESGKFQAMMEISYINDGPVTILLDSRKIF